MSQARFQKQQREKARREKAAAKVTRRDEREAAKADEPGAKDAPPQDRVLADLAALHADFDAERISFEDFEVAKSQLMEDLRVD